MTSFNIGYIGPDRLKSRSGSQTIGGKPNGAADSFDPHGNLLVDQAHCVLLIKSAAK